MPNHLSAELIERLRRVAETFRTPDEVKATVRAAIAGSRSDAKNEGK